MFVGSASVQLSEEKSSSNVIVDEAIDASCQYLSAVSFSISIELSSRLVGFVSVDKALIRLLSL